MRHLNLPNGHLHLRMRMSPKKKTNGMIPN
jgi:hypothetical protein